MGSFRDCVMSLPLIVRIRVMSSNLIDAYTKEYGSQRMRLVSMLLSDIRRLPPNGSFLKARMSPSPCFFIRSFVGKFLISTRRNNTYPLVLIGNFVYFETNHGIGAHPLDLFSQGRKAVKVAAIESEVHRHDIRLVVFCAGQPSNVCARQHLIAFS